MVLWLGLTMAPVRVALANPSALIAVVRDPQTDERTLTRLHSELDALGLTVRVVAAPAGDRNPRTLERAAREVGAFAALRIVPWEGGIEVWIADRVTGKTLLRELVVAPGEAADEVVALRAVELLRASLLELELPHKPSGQVPPPPAVKRLVSRLEVSRSKSAHRFGIGLGAGPLLSPGGIDPSWQLLLKARYVMAPRWGAELFVLLPTVPSTIQQPEGSADISVFFLGAALTVDLLPKPDPWTARAALGVGSAVLRMAGSASPLYVSGIDNVVVALPHTRLDLLYSISSDVRLGASIWSGVALPRATVKFAGRQVASWGRPAGAGTALFEFDF
jgi:hypothetical protein